MKTQIYYKVTFDENDIVVQVESSKTEGDGFKAYNEKQIKLLAKFGTTKEQLEKAL